MNTRNLSELGQELTRNKTVLHQIAIDLGLLKDDNFIFQYDFSDYGSYGNGMFYSIISPKNDIVLSIPKDSNEFENLPFKVVKKLKEYGFDIGD